MMKKRLAHTIRMNGAVAFGIDKPGQVPNGSAQQQPVPASTNKHHTYFLNREKTIMVTQSWAGTLRPAQRKWNDRQQISTILGLPTTPAATQNESQTDQRRRSTSDSHHIDSHCHRMGRRSTGLFGQPVSLHDALSLDELDAQLRLDLDDSLPAGDLPGQLLLDLGLGNKRGAGQGSNNDRRDRMNRHRRHMD